MARPQKHPTARTVGFFLGWWVGCGWWILQQRVRRSAQQSICIKDRAFEENLHPDISMIAPSFAVGSSRWNGVQDSQSEFLVMPLHLLIAKLHGRLGGLLNNIFRQTRTA